MEYWEKQMEKNNKLKKSIKNGTCQFASYGNILGDIRFQLACFQHVEFKYISFVCNFVVDALEDLPNDIAPLVLRDVH